MPREDEGLRPKQEAICAAPEPPRLTRLAARVVLEVSRAPEQPSDASDAVYIKEPVVNVGGWDVGAGGNLTTRLGYSSKANASISAAGNPVTVIVPSSSTWNSTSATSAMSAGP